MTITQPHTVTNDLLLDVRNLQIRVTSAWDTDATVIDGVSLQLRKGDSVGLVGESGSGKTMLGLSLLQLLPPAAQITGGTIELSGQTLIGLSENQLCAVRGRQIAMVFQDPMTGLNPLRRVGSLLTDAARRAGANKREAHCRAIESMQASGIPKPEERLRAYPHQLSGGLRQRVMIALALINKPSIIVADEPTTALDATIQAQILDLLRTISEERAIILITHDLGVVAEVCDRIIVMYAGHVMEQGLTAEVLDNPQHPYTQGLISCRPRIGPRTKERLRPIRGMPPRLGEIPSGCVFCPRCPRVQDGCGKRPPLGERDSHLVACWFPGAGVTHAAREGWADGMS